MSIRKKIFCGRGVTVKLTHNDKLLVAKVRFKADHSLNNLSIPPSVELPPPPPENREFKPKYREK